MLGAVRGGSALLMSSWVPDGDVHSMKGGQMNITRWTRFVYFKVESGDCEGRRIFRLDLTLFPGTCQPYEWRFDDAVHLPRFAGMLPGYPEPLPSVFEKQREQFPRLILFIA